MKKLCILLIILILGSCKPTWNDVKSPIIVRGVQTYNAGRISEKYKYTIVYKSTLYTITSYDLYNIGDTVEIKVK